MSVQDAEVDWPAPLRRYATNGRGPLKLRSRGPHWSVWIAVPFGFALASLGLMAITGIAVAWSALTVIVGILVSVFAAAVLASAAYSAWGSLELERRGTRWIVISRLGRWTRAAEFDQDDVRFVDEYNPAPFTIMWPGNAGRRVRIFRSAASRPVELGAGLVLDEGTLTALRQLFTDSSQPSHQVGDGGEKQ